MFTLLSLFLLLNLNFRRITESLIVMRSSPFALVKQWRRLEAYSFTSP
ncbi:MAG: hypothetical protein WC107_08010 [Patescibacteria group bacterium]